MSAETLFTIANNGVIPFWLLLAIAPGWKGTQILVHTFAIPMLLAVLYLHLAVTSFGGGDFFSLTGVAALFSDSSALLAGWVHYLIFDLFVGAWIVRDSRRLRIHHGLVVPCLLFTLMLGPVGLLMYYMLRIVLRKQITLDETVRSDDRRGEPAPMT